MNLSETIDVWEWGNLQLAAVYRNGSLAEIEMYSKDRQSSVRINADVLPSLWRLLHKFAEAQEEDTGDPED